MNLLSPVSGIGTTFAVISCEHCRSDLIAENLDITIAGINCSDPHLRISLRDAWETSSRLPKMSVHKSLYFH